MFYFLLTLAAGMGGMGLGAAVTAAMRRRDDRLTCAFLSFAGGIMISVVCFGLIPEALDDAPVWISLGGLIFGAAVIQLLNRAVDRLTKAVVSTRQPHASPEALFHAEDLLDAGTRPALLRSGILMLMAISLHIIPEGMAIGAGGAHDETLGIMLAVMIALHNIPEGMAVGAPLMAGGLAPRFTVLLVTLSGFPMAIGGLLGLLLGGLSAAVTAFVLAAAGGAMLYVVFGEVIPQAVTMQRTRLPTIVSLAGLLAGLLLCTVL